MQLKKLEMYGFKSFANKTEFQFSPGITAFVGPNGGGKSNVVDALRWVLGEQNPRVLRATKMEDLIFAGSENSNQKNFAEVSIMLDNSDREIDLEYSEITITRRYYRSGDSDYFINRVPCRLKDISEMLASTSLGRGTYSIIGQGQVEEVINSRPEERRSMFEEAAGIALYKMRKRDALNKLTSTRGNLTRIEDIVHELSGQEDEVRQGAELAEDYLKLKKEAKEIYLALWAGKYSDLKDKLKKSGKRRCQLEQNRDQAQQQLDSLQKSLDTHADKMQEFSQLISSLEQKKSQLSEQKTNLEYQLQLAEQRKSDVHTLVSSTRNNMNHLQTQMEQTREKITEVEAELATLDEQLSQFTAALEYRSSAAGLSRRLLAMGEKYRSQVDEGILKSALASDEYSSNRDKAQQQVAEIEGQLTSISQDLSEGQKQQYSTEQQLSQVEEQRGQLVSECDDLAAILDQVKSDLARRQQTEAKQERVVNQLVNSRNALEQKRDMLVGMEQELQGLSAGARAALKASANKQLSGVHDALANLVRVDSKHSLALETALAGALNYVVCQDDDACRRSIDYLKQTGGGRATFVPLTAGENSPNRRESLAHEIVGWADELVEVEPQYRPLITKFLSRVIVASDLKSATQLAKDTRYRYKIVTLDGDVVSRGLYTGGSARHRGPGLLQRKADISNLGAQLEDIDVRIQQQQAELDGIVEERQRLAAKQTEVQQDFEDKQRKLYGVQAEKQHIQSQLTNIKQKIAQGQQRLKELEDRHTQAQAVFDSVVRRIDQDKVELQALRAARTSFADQEESLRNLVALWASRQNSLQLTVYSLENKKDNLQRQLEHMYDRREEFEVSLQKATAEVADKEQQIVALSEQMAQYRQTFAELTQGLETAAASLDGKSESQHVLQRKIAATKDKIAEVSQQLAATNKTLHDIDVKEARWQAEDAAMTQELAAQHGINPDQGLAYRDSVHTLNELSGRLRKVQGSIQEMGPVNLAAIEQHKKLGQRLTFLREQRADLVSAEQDIIDLVSELDQSIRTQFLDTFENVQQHFTRIFKILFDGGNAYLSLSKEEDILDAGVEIFARPPGKKTQALSLLSGGEKAMTAIALLFALQSVRPSPFCVLDEIEAALDDVNIVRFAKYVRQLAAEMQFILITHRRETMENADSLYGITLNKDGSSKPISVTFNKKKDENL